MVSKPVLAETNASAGRIVMVQNWLDELRRVAPPRDAEPR
jgi:hypothetical protein